MDLQPMESTDMRDLLIRRRNLLLRKQEEGMNIRAVCFEADGEQTVAITKVGSAPAITMQYSYDGVTWESWGLSDLPFGGETKVYVRGVSNVQLGTDIDNYNTFTFSSNAYVYVSGIVESLLDGENEVPTIENSYSLCSLFDSQSSLRSVKNLRFEAISICDHAYFGMFYNCSNLLYAPKVLPANNFSGSDVYSFMFSGCTSMITAPKLPATTLSDSCYSYMFQGCRSLVNAPELPATTLSSSCYYNMFYNCTSLKTIRCRAKVKASSATSNWMSGVKTAGTIYGYSEYGWATGASGIPSGWEFVELTD